MTYLISHLWLLYLLSLVLAGIAYTVIDIHAPHPVYCLEAAVYAAIPDLIAVFGLWCFKKEHMIPAIIIAVLSCVATGAAVWLFWTESKIHDHFSVKAEGIAAGILCIIALILCSISFAGNLAQILLTSCCLCGMISVACIFGYLIAFARGMGSP